MEVRRGKGGKWDSTHIQEKDTVYTKFCDRLFIVHEYISLRSKNIFSVFAPRVVFSFTSYHIDLPPRTRGKRGKRGKCKFYLREVNEVKSPRAMRWDLPTLRTKEVNFHRPRSGATGRGAPSTLAYTPNDCPLLPPSTGSSAPHWGEALNKYLLLFAEIAVPQWFHGMRLCRAYVRYPSTWK
jgi:hypothetical protein